MPAALANRGAPAQRRKICMKKGRIAPSFFLYFIAEKYQCDAASMLPKKMANSTPMITASRMKITRLISCTSTALP